MACNLLHDGRIGSKREIQLDEYGGKGIVAHPRTGIALSASVRDFFDKRIRSTSSPDYVKRELNGHNFIQTASGVQAQGINPTVSLARIIDLTGLRRVYIWAEEQGLPEFEGFEADERDTGLNEYLAARLAAPGGDRASAFVAAVLDALDRRRKPFPFEPVWAVWWADFEPYVDESAHRWLDLLGMRNAHTEANPRWLIALKYPLASVAPLVRPTQIDADWFPFHFPSPSTAAAEKGGHPMDLTMPPPNTTLLCEFIHQQIRHDVTQVQGGPRQTTSPQTGNLHRQRVAHLDRIQHFYNQLDGWIGTCI